jgi:hypothetical protein
MKKTLSISFLVYLSVIICSGQRNFSGHWNSHSERSSFSLFLTQKQDSLIGYHISVMENGNRIDASYQNEITIRGKILKDSAIIIFKSTYCRMYGFATIYKTGPDTLKWKITNPPHGLFYIPRSAIS